ncbi:Nitrate reductase-like protein NarX [Streptomyces sp. F-1]|nr:Nitrate reductase-like protein NarX [Streptomyces sp. F-1]
MHVHEWLYHANALAVGGAAGLATLTGLAVLLYRRLRVPAVRAATSRSDRAVYPVLAGVLLVGLTATATTLGAHPYDYRRGVSIWFRSLFTLDPNVPAVAHAPLVYQVHALFGMALFALWPFSRLVHAFAAPVATSSAPTSCTAHAVPTRSPRPTAAARTRHGTPFQARPAGPGGADPAAGRAPPDSPEAAPELLRGPRYRRRLPARGGRQGPQPRATARFSWRSRGRAGCGRS